MGCLKSTVAGAVTGGIFAGMGNIAGSLSQAGGLSEGFRAAFAEGGLGRVALHAVAGGVTSEAFGGDLRSGFLSAGFAEWAGPTIPTPDVVVQTVARSVIGGTASVLGGGKFANGAMTAAFAYLFNHCAHAECLNYMQDAVEPSYIIEDALSVVALPFRLLGFGIRGLSALTQRGAYFRCAR